MISVDTNILFYAQNRDCQEHERAFACVLETGRRSDVVICELVLAELYVLLRNPALLERPLTSKMAVEVCMIYRSNPKWRLVENAPVMDGVWQLLASQNYARRKIFDIRLAFTLLHHGVKDLMTVNVKDFQGLGFDNVWNPLKS